MVCSGSSIESLHVLGTLQYLLESALQVKYHLLYRCGNRHVIGNA